jgi:subfamily B ATP-binding cassette protein MsbA
VSRRSRDSKPSGKAPARWRQLRPYAQMLGKHRSDLILSNLLMVVSTGVSLAIPLIAGRFVDGLTKQDPRIRTWVPLAWLGGLLVIQLGTTYLYTVVANRFGLGYVTSLRRRLMAHLLELPSLFFTFQKAGDLSARMTSDVGSIQNLMTTGIVSLLRAGITLGGTIGLMFMLNARLTLVILAVVPATILLVRLFGNRLHRLARQMYDELGRISSHVQEVTEAIRIIKVYNSQGHERARFEQMIDRYYGNGMRRARLAAALDSGSQILLWLCLITIVVYGFWLTSRQQMTFGQLVTFFLWAYRVAVPMSTLTGVYTSAQGAMAAADRLSLIFSTPPERLPHPAAGAHVSHHGAVSVQDVTFAYAEEAVIRNLTLHVQAGEWVGIVGPSGAGKTTLSGLILRLFDPQFGDLRLDGRPYREYELAELRGQMAYVSQEPFLYDVSIAENIRFGLKGASEDELREAVRQAGALEFIEALPQGLGTLCGERGVRLSGGQRQRITLARAFLRNPRILVMDEPTSALDAQSEEEVRTAMAALMRDRTAIVIAHRLSLVRDLNRIFVLSAGRLVEEGDHEQLLARGGLYSSLYHLQHRP